MLLDIVQWFAIAFYLGKPTSHSSTYESLGSGYGVNGILADITATDDDEKPYWRVNLQGVCTVAEVIVFNSEECELTSFELTTSIH